MTNAKERGPGRGFWLSLGLVAVLGLGALGYVASKPKVTSTAVDPTLPKLKAEGYLLGSPNAPIEVIEFADFECPGCGQFANLTEPDVRTNLVNTGKVRIRFMDYPLPMHRNTWDASLAAACANEQGKFWEMHDMLFANQDRWNGEATSKPRPIIAEMAKGLGLDMTKYGSCMDNETQRAKVQSHLLEAQRRNVTQTPTFIVGDVMVPGALPYDSFKKLVDDAMAKLSAKADTSAKKAADTAKAKAK
ncbi:MAG: DsbA family protein [bacterium]